MVAVFPLAHTCNHSYHGLHNVTVYIFDAHRKLSFSAYFNIPVIQHAHAHIPCLELGFLYIGELKLGFLWEDGHKEQSRKISI